MDTASPGRLVLAGLLHHPPSQGDGGEQHKRARPEAGEPPANPASPAPLAARSEGEQRHTQVEGHHPHRPGHLQQPSQPAVAPGAAAPHHRQQERERPGQHLQPEPHHDRREQASQAAVEVHNPLLALFGVGPDSASALLLAAGDNPERLHSGAAFAALCGVSPVEASSGRTIRHRLNRGGDRQANAALYRIVVVRLRWHQPTKDYMARRLAEGKTPKEVIRCLKRYVAREVFTVLNQMTKANQATAA
jgi:transposase